MLQEWWIKMMISAMMMYGSNVMINFFMSVGPRFFNCYIENIRKINDKCK